MAQTRLVHVLAERDGVRAGEAVLARAQGLARRGLAVDTARAELEEEVPVLVCHARLLEVAHARVEDLAIDQRARIAVVALHQAVEVVAGWLEEVVARTEVADRRIDEADLLAGALELVDQALDRIGQQHVVGVHRQHVAAAGELEPRVARGARARVLLEAEDLDLLETVEHLEGVGVARRVVDDDHLDVRIRLRAQGVEALAEEAAVVVAGDDRGDERLLARWAGAEGQLVRRPLSAVRWALPRRRYLLVEGLVLARHSLQRELRSHARACRLALTPRQLRVAGQALELVRIRGRRAARREQGRGLVVDHLG